MALTQGSIITISEINAEFDTKIDTAGAGLSKDGTSLALASLHSASGSAGPSANATPAYGETFTVPQVNYDEYGRVTGHNDYTVQIPATPSITNISGTAAKASAISNCAGWSAKYNYNNWKWGAGTFSQGSATSGTHYWAKWKAPSGGTWGVFVVSDSAKGKQISGGTTIELRENCFAIRIA